MDIQAHIEKLWPVGNDDEWSCPSSYYNVADQPTRPDLSPKDVNLDSSCESGPSYLCDSFSQ